MLYSRNVNIQILGGVGDAIVTNGTLDLIAKVACLPADQFTVNHNPQTQQTQVSINLAQVLNTLDNNS